MSLRVIILSVLLLVVSEQVSCGGGFFSRKKKTNDNQVSTDKQGEKSSTSRFPKFSSIKKKMSSAAKKLLFNQRKQCKVASESILKEVAPLVEGSTLSVQELDNWVHEHEVKLNDLELSLQAAQKTLTARQMGLKEEIAKEAATKTLEQWTQVYKGDIAVQGTIIKYAKQIRTWLEEGKSFEAVPDELYPIAEREADAQKQSEIFEIIEKHYQDKNANKETELSESQLENKYVEMTRLSQKGVCSEFLIGNIRESYQDSVFDFLENEISISEAQIKRYHEKLHKLHNLIDKRDLLKVQIEPTEIDISDRPDFAEKQELVRASEEHLEQLREEKNQILEAHTSHEKQKELSGIILDISNQFEPCQTLLKTQKDDPLYSNCKADVLELTQKFLKFKEFNWGMIKKRRYEEGELKLLKEIASSIKRIGIDCGF